MDEEKRADLIEQIKELDDAMEALEAARRPYDRAISAVSGVKEALLEQHEAEIVGKCEVCMTPIFEGDDAWTAGGEDAVKCCKEHAPTWGDELREAKEMPDEAWDEPGGRERFIALCESKPADEKHVWKH